MSGPTARFDSRFSDPKAEATPWEEARSALERAELYWLTTVRADGRPHVTPLIGVHHAGAVHFVTGTGEQKFRNLDHSRKVALKYGEVWHFDVAGDAVDGQGEDPGHVFRVEPVKVMAFAKDPHGQTSYRFG